MQKTRQNYIFSVYFQDEEWICSEFPKTAQGYPGANEDWLTQGGWKQVREEGGCFSTMVLPLYLLGNVQCVVSGCRRSSPVV